MQPNSREVKIFLLEHQNKSPKEKKAYVKRNLESILKEKEDILHWYSYFDTLKYKTLGKPLLKITGGDYKRYWSIKKEYLDMAENMMYNDELEEKKKELEIKRLQKQILEVDREIKKLQEQPKPTELKKAEKIKFIKERLKELKAQKASVEMISKDKQKAIRDIKDDKLRQLISNMYDNLIMEVMK